MRFIVPTLLALQVIGAYAQEPAKHVGVFVDPYYRAAADPTGSPSVSVAKAFDARLGMNDPKKIREVEAEIRAKPGLITPMTLMVLSIRLYDTGFRDEAVFWHYAAKDRMRTIAHVASGGISGAVVATRDFAATAGRTINGYAFCDFNKQRAARRAAFEWVRDNPYQAIFMERLPSRFTDRAAALQDVLAQIEDDLRKEAEYIGDPENRKAFQMARQENGANAKFCW